MSSLNKKWLIVLSDPDLKANKVSVPLLAQDLAKKERVATAEAVRRISPRLSEVPMGWMEQIELDGDDADADESELLASLPELGSKHDREFTYGNIVYRHFRSGYVHRYSPDPLIDSGGLVTNQGDIVYSCWSDGERRRIHFKPSWIGKVVRSIIRSSDEVFDQKPLPEPKKWWVTGT